MDVKLPKLFKLNTLMHSNKSVSITLAPISWV